MFFSARTHLGGVDGVSPGAGNVKVLHPLQRVGEASGVSFRRTPPSGGRPSRAPRSREGRRSFADRKHFVMLHNIYDVAELHLVALFVCPAAGVLRPTRRSNILDVYEHGLEGFPRRMILGVKRSWADLREGRLRSWVPDARVQPCVSAAPGRHVHIDPASRAFFWGDCPTFKNTP